jgi:hypothetical protein
LDEGIGAGYGEPHVDRANTARATAPRSAPLALVLRMACLRAKIRALMALRNGLSFSSTSELAFY